MEAVTKDLVARDKQAANDREEGDVFNDGGFPGLRGAPTSVKTFIEKRAASVTAQLDGKCKGFLPNMPSGMGGPGGG